MVPSPQTESASLCGHPGGPLGRGLCRVRGEPLGHVHLPRNDVPPASSRAASGRPGAEGPL